MTVLEVVRHDRVTGAYVIAAGFGERSDWLRNLAEHPETSIQVGRRLLAVRAVRLPAEKAGDELVDYQRRHPDAFSALARLLGYRVDGSEADARAMSAFLPFVALQPVVADG